MKQSPTRSTEEAQPDLDYSSILEAVPTPCLILSPDDEFRIVAVTEAYRVATMTTEMDIIGKGLFEVFPDNPDDLSADGVSNLRFSLNEVLRTKTMHKMEIQKYDIRRPDGVFEERYWSPLNKPVLNRNGDIMVIIHYVENVTLYMQMKKEALEREEVSAGLRQKLSDIDVKLFKRVEETLLKNSFEKMMEGIQIIGYDWTYLYVNDAAARQGKSTKEALIGKKMYDVYPDIEHTPLFDVISRCMKERGAELIENEFRYPDRSRGWFELNIQPVPDGVMILSMDISARKKSEYERILLNEKLESKVEERTAELESANQELESFTYSVSHDLRAPLRAIDGYARILAEEHEQELSPDGRRLLNVITSNTKKMGSLIDDLLAFSRLGKQTMVKVKVNMNKLVFSAGEEALRHSKNENTRISYGTFPETECDSSMIRLVFNNLFSNAVKYSGKKDVPVIEVGVKEGNGENIFYIKDNGAGFDMNYYNKLFGVFQRLHSSVEFEGTGVGLALVQRILHRHGGRIWAESTIGEGATFYFTIEPPKQKE